ncbi:MAG: DNA translocase FtsK [Pseudomonadota bacterium]
MAGIIGRTRQRRFVGTAAEQALRRRGAEAIGLGLLIAGGAFAALIATYAPDDPSLFNATGAAPKNALGLIGASIADPMFRALGWAAWGAPATLIVWGLRLIVHRGDERVLSRAIVAPLAIAVGATLASAHVPLERWPHPYGLGGVFGDAALRTVLDFAPIAPVAALPAATVALGAIFLLLAAFALGFVWADVATGLRQVWRMVRTVLGLGGRATTFAARQGVRGAKVLHERRKVQRLSRQKQREAEIAAREAAGDLPLAGAEAKPGDDMPPAERLTARISAAVRARREAGQPAAERREPTLDAPMRAVPELPEDLDPGFETPDHEGETHDLDGPQPMVRRRDAGRTPESAAARREMQPSLAFDDGPAEAEYQAPPLSLLSNPRDIVRHHLSDDALEQNARMLENVLDDYGIRGEIVAVRPGPVVTMYELEPAPGLKASRVIGLADDIARSMSALSARISTVPGRSVIGIELPNEEREKVLLREILSSKAYGDSAHRLPLALGKDISGAPVVVNLSRMPHLLVAGTTGSGKSVAINTMILSLLYRLGPEDVRLIMIDPKMLELSVYDNIPHLLSPVVTDPKKAVVALKWVVAEMEERYRKMSKMGVRNIDGYNARVREALEAGEAFTRVVQTGFDEATGEPVFETEEFAPETMPYIVVVVDEMADLMMVAGKEIEACIQRLAQMARASGIHLIMATQRPSVDVITGTIKANFPTRISFQVTSKIDSRTILGEQGAEQLLGQGDMLYMAGGGRITRVHAPFVSDEEVEEVVTHLKSLGQPDYVSGVVEGPEGEEEASIDAVLGLGGNTGGDDALYDQAVAIVARDRKCSTSYIQRKLAIGYNKAARLVEQMEDAGVVSTANQVGKRDVLVPEP